MRTRFLPRGSIAIWFLLACGACRSLAEQSSEQPQPAGSAAVSSAGEAGNRAGGGATGTGGTQPALDAAPPTTPADAGREPMHDSGAAPSDAPDAGAAPEPAPDAALPDAATLGGGSCCSQHETPGCDNADLQVCVCELLSSCCTEAWGEACVLIVEQKYCQPGVRECVCGEGDGQWGQKTCCEADWSETFCDEVAESKCGAVPGCF